MIIDNIKNVQLYYGLNERLDKALKYMKESSISSMAPGKYEIDGTDVYILVQQYESKPLEEGKWEAHRKYIDIQFVVSGKERIGYADIENLSVIKDYDETGDYLLLDGTGTLFTVGEGYFAVLFPDDAHMPGIAVQKPEHIKKAVLKVRV